MPNMEGYNQPGDEEEETVSKDYNNPPSYLRQSAKLITTIDFKWATDRMEISVILEQSLM